MEIPVISDTITTVVATQCLGFSKFLLNRNNFSLSDSSSEQQPRQISAVISPVDALAPPPVKVRRAPQRLARKIRRTTQKSLGGESDDGDDNAFLFGDDGPFGGGGSSWGGGGGGSSGGGGRGWNFGGGDWEEESSSSWGSVSDPAFDFVYELMCWVVMSNCLHFAFKRVVRIVADGFSDPARDKVPMRLTPVY